MSRLYYDHLVSLKKLEKHINKIARTKEEKHELWAVVDEVIHHKVVGCILDKLDEKDHEEFLVKLYEEPHDEGIWEYIKKKVKTDVVEFVKEELNSLEHEILTDVKKGKGKAKKSSFKKKKSKVK